MACRAMEPGMVPATDADLVLSRSASRRFRVLSSPGSASISLIARVGPRYVRTDWWERGPYQLGACPRVPRALPPCTLSHVFRSTAMEDSWMEPRHACPSTRQDQGFDRRAAVHPPSSTSTPRARHTGAATRRAGRHVEGGPRLVATLPFCRAVGPSRRRAEI
jgi:hypothetical protein